MNWFGTHKQSASRKAGRQQAAWVLDISEAASRKAKRRGEGYLRQTGRRSRDIWRVADTRHRHRQDGRHDTPTGWLTDCEVSLLFFTFPPKHWFSQLPYRAYQFSSLNGRKIATFSWFRKGSRILSLSRGMWQFPRGSWSSKFEKEIC